MNLLLAFATITLGSYVQSSIGFGLAIIAAPVLFFIDPHYVPAPITVSAFTLSIVNAWGHRKSISLRGLKYAVIGRIPGSLAGALLIVWIDQELLGLWLGITVLLAVAVSLKAVALTPTPGHMAVAGFMSGFMGTSSSIGGPPMALLMQHQEARYIRANLSAFFVVSCLMSLSMLAPVGYFGLREINLALPLLPGTLLGYWLARQTWHLISPRFLRLSSLGLCSVCGAIAIVSFWF
ncbi:MAG: sulfite exporter TauE/SafE family protein [Gammaproteobacteria bacterium]|nr:sulfite exporter TauE/SafE family protein [Pseudomonadales bacterium]MCP5346470.1 sulfite exporter TauE/SafE family protein [Pseudomonadales bacterium]